MNFGLKINRKDVVTIVLVSIVFFSIAVWNVGSIQYPTSYWQATKPESFYINLGSVQPVQTVYFWTKTGNATVDVSVGSPGNWTSVGNVTLQYPPFNHFADFYPCTVDANTQYLSFYVQPINYDSRPDFWWSVPNPSDKLPSPFIQISEIGLQSQSNTQITIPSGSIYGENTTDPTLYKLIDEQSKLQIPPDYMQKMYFDEIYFVPSAVAYLHLQIPLERTHPPLGKLIQASGIAVFGETPFGWRIMGVIFGTLMVPLMYLLGKKLFGTWIGGFSASFLFTFDFMHFTMARLGTADTYVVFFSLLSQLFFLIYFMELVKNGWKTSALPLFLAVIFFALGFSTKWFTIFSAAGMLMLLVAYRFKDVLKLKGSLGEKYVAFFDYPALPLIGFMGLSVVIYFASYIPDMLAGDSFGSILNLQNSMASFMSGNVGQSSTVPWWSWPFMTGINRSVPYWFDITFLPHNMVSTITAMGNPVVWWVGFACALLLAGLVIYESGVAQELWNRLARQKLTEKTGIKPTDWPGIYIIVVFFFAWLPYIIISRSTYIYHFYMSVPLICFATTYFINKFWSRPLGKAIAIAIFASAVILFIVFYPVISGMPVSESYVDKLKWLNGWYFAP
jgi:4-amino-4-deoxy-L-arabinose transferase-like glycosyltransferase